MYRKNHASDAVPAYFFDRLTDIPPDLLKRIGVKACAVDLDNTLVYDYTACLLDGVPQWVENAEKAGIRVMILSNGGEKRVKRVAERLGVLYIAKARKPGCDAFFAAADKLGVNIGETAMIGDQLFTDIRGANRAGAVSVRVRFAQREKRWALRYRLLRKREAKYLKKAGYGDKI